VVLAVPRTPTADSQPVRLAGSLADRCCSCPLPGTLSLVRACPNCASNDLDLIQRLGGPAMVLRCVNCGHQWQHGEPPKAAEPGQTQEQRLRAKFPTAEDVSAERLAALEALAREDRHRHWAEEQGEFRHRFQTLFSPEGLPRLTPRDFYDFYRSERIANVGPASLVADRYVKEWGLEEYGERAIQAVEYLLLDGRRTLEQKLTDLIASRRPPAVPGIKEAILTKVLVVAMPDRMFPLLVYDSPGGSGKRQVARGVFDLDMPERDRTAWTIGRLIIWSNDLFLDVGRRLGFPDAHSAGDFVWWVWNQQRAGKDPLDG
jgi:hypothetical protein